MNVPVLKSFWYECDGTRLHAVEQGEGTPVVLLHGGMADHRAVMQYLVPLSVRHRVIAPDLRGSGKSWYGGELSFTQLSGDLLALLDHAGVRRAVLIGVSGGGGVLMAFTLAHPDRVAGFVVVSPAYGGDEAGFTPEQRTAFAGMDSIASRALTDGIDVLKLLYATAPDAYRELAIAMSMEFDPASVVATSRLLASGAQPFRSMTQLRRLTMPALIVRGADAVHPSQVSAGYIEALPDCRAIAADDARQLEEIEAFCAACGRA
jgi:pimeloyl-ACP methyl ester carboxylesterase